jgi:hypothetical protein
MIKKKWLKEWEPKLDKKKTKWNKISMKKKNKSRK